MSEPQSTSEVLDVGGREPRFKRLKTGLSVLGAGALAVAALHGGVGGNESKGSEPYKVLAPRPAELVVNPEQVGKEFGRVASLIEKSVLANATVKGQPLGEVLDNISQNDIRKQFVEVVEQAQLGEVSTTAHVDLNPGEEAVKLPEIVVEDIYGEDRNGATQHMVTVSAMLDKNGIIGNKQEMSPKEVDGIVEKLAGRPIKGKDLILDANSTLQGNWRTYEVKGGTVYISDMGEIKLRKIDYPSATPNMDILAKTTTLEELAAKVAFGLTQHSVKPEPGTLDAFPPSIKGKLAHAVNANRGSRVIYDTANDLYTSLPVPPSRK